MKSDLNNKKLKLELSSLPLSNVPMETCNFINRSATYRLEPIGLEETVDQCLYKYYKSSNIYPLVKIEEFEEISSLVIKQIKLGSEYLNDHETVEGMNTSSACLNYRFSPDYLFSGLEDIKENIAKHHIELFFDVRRNIDKYLSRYVEPSPSENQYSKLLFEQSIKYYVEIVDSFQWMHDNVGSLKLTEDNKLWMQNEIVFQFGNKKTPIVEIC